MSDDENSEASRKAEARAMSADDPKVKAAIDLLRSKLKKGSESFRGRAADNQTRGFRLKMGVTILGAATTLLLGLKTNSIFLPHEPYLSAVALLISAMVPILAAYDAYYDHRWLWTQYTAAYTTFYEISNDLEYAVAMGTVGEKLDSLYARFQAAYNNTNSAWQDKRVKTSEADSSKQ